jgi:hypothetical protein
MGMETAEQQERALNELGVNDLRALIEDTLAYFERMVHAPEDEPWRCTIIANEPKQGENDTASLKLRVSAPQSNGARLLITYKASSPFKVTTCTGKVDSLLTNTSSTNTSSTNTSSTKASCQLEAYGNLLDYLIVQLCQALCVPRAPHYMVCCMKLHVNEALVDKHMQLLESKEMGTFALVNGKQAQRCAFRVRFIPAKNREPCLYYSDKDGKEKKLLPKLKALADLSVPTMPEGIDYIQHAFRRSQDTNYVQHPAVAKALHLLLQHAGLAEMDEEVRQRAEVILAQQTAAHKSTRGKPESGTVFGLGG